MSLLTAKAKKELTDFLLEPFPDNFSKAWFLEKLDDNYLERVAELQLLTGANPNAYIEFGLFTEEELDNTVRETITRIIHSAFGSTNQSLLQELALTQRFISVFGENNETYPALNQLFTTKIEANLLSVFNPMEVKFLDKHANYRFVGKTIYGALYQQILLAFLLEFSDLLVPNENSDCGVTINTPLLYLPNYYGTNLEDAITFADNDTIKASAIMQETFMTLVTCYLPDLSSKQHNDPKEKTTISARGEEYQRLIWIDFVYHQRVTEEVAKDVIDINDQQMDSVLVSFAIDTSLKNFSESLFPILWPTMLNKTYQHQQTKEQVYVTNIIPTPDVLLSDNRSAKGYINSSKYTICYHAPLDDDTSLPSTLTMKTFEDFIFDTWEILPDNHNALKEI